MITKKAIAAEKEGLLDLKGLVGVYEEIAAGRMQKVRQDVLLAREFLDGLVRLFGEVRRAYPKRGKKGNGKTVAVFVSANAGLYGDIVDRVFADFVKYVREKQPEVVVLGKHGVKMIAERTPAMLYNYFDFADDRVELESLGLVMRYLVQFENIVVFYGRFKSIALQVPVATEVTGEVKSQQETENRKYLFEPELAEISRVFEREIVVSVFEQTLHESQLAKFASRLLSLDRSVENIDERLGGLAFAERRLKHKIMGKKQLTRMAAIMYG